MSGEISLTPRPPLPISGKGEQRQPDSPLPQAGEGLGVREISTRHTPRKTPDQQLSHARAMRREAATEVEKRLWRRIRARQLSVKFRRQHPVGPYIADFACLEIGLVIELDGGQHGLKAGMKYDDRRNEALSKAGFRVLRFWNNDVIDNLEGVLEAIRLAVSQTSLTPQPPLPISGEEEQKKRTESK